MKWHTLQYVFNLIVGAKFKSKAINNYTAEFFIKLPLQCTDMEMSPETLPIKMISLGKPIRN